MRRLAERIGLKAESDELLHLDLMRFVASVGVMVLHSHLFLFPADMRDAVAARTHNLALFVDLFFVISGFVISYVYADRVRSASDYGRFLQRRIGRLLPLHLATMAAAIAVTLLVLAIGTRFSTMPSFSAQCIVGTAFLLHEVIPCGGTSFNAVSWSISVEMALYVLFPLMLLVTRRSAILAFLLAAVALGAFSGWSGNLEAAWQEGYRPLRGMASFAFGMGLYHARAPLARMPFVGVGLAVSALAMVAAMTMGAPRMVCLALVCLTATLAVASDMRGKVHPVVRSLAPLGQLTYSMYMIHWIVFVGLLGFGDKILRLSTGPMLALMLASYAAVFMLSWLSFRYFETPMRRRIDRLPVFSRPRGAAPGEAPPLDLADVVRAADGRLPAPASGAGPVIG